jgi:hypothetical protein
VAAVRLTILPRRSWDRRGERVERRSALRGESLVHDARIVPLAPPHAADRRQRDVGVGAPRIGCQLPLVGPSGPEALQEAAELGAEAVRLRPERFEALGDPVVAVEGGTDHG